MSWGTLGGRVTWGFKSSGRNYEVQSYTGHLHTGPDGIIAEYEVEDEDGTPHEVAFRFKFIKKDR